MTPSIACGLPPWVLPLESPGATLEHVGGKGASLARLAIAGLPVPPAFYLTTSAYRRFVAANNLQNTILPTPASVCAGDPPAFQDLSKRIVALFLEGTIPDEVVTAILDAYAALGANDPPVAIRSSATAEDLPGMSFAGQQESYLNIRGQTMLLDAVKRCWASLWTSRAIAYRTHHQIPAEDVSLAVVIQKLVPADVAGVLFTANPVTGTRNEVLINAAWGLGEAIVGGLVNPDMYVVDKRSGALLAQQIADKAVMTVRTENGTEDAPVPVEDRRLPALSVERAAQLADLGVRIEALYEQPMDIEWTLHHGHISIVQARPITALPPITG